MTAVALLDSNVLIAMMVIEHPHHTASLNVLAAAKAIRCAVAAHSFAETYNVLTREGERAPYRFAPEDAWAALESVRSATDLVGLTAAQTFDTVKRYAQNGGIGARLYDALIGEVAVIHRIPTLVTWNIGHMRGLFPKLVVTTPVNFSATRVAPRAGPV